MFQNLSSTPSRQAKSKRQRSQATTLPLTESESLNLFSCRLLHYDPTSQFMHKIVSGRIQRGPESLRAYCSRDRDHKAKRSPYQENQTRRTAFRSRKVRGHLINLLTGSDQSNRSSELSLHLYLARRAQGLRLAQGLEDDVELEQLCDGIAGMAGEADSDDTFEAAQKTEWSSEDDDGVDDNYVFYEDMSDEEDEGHSDETDTSDDEEEEEEKVVELDVQMSA